MDIIFPKIDFIKIYNRYSYLLKDTFHNETDFSSKIKLKNTDRTCFGTNLKKTEYQNYKRNKTPITVIRCRNKINETEKFCKIHKDLCGYLDEKTHESEKLFDGELVDLYDNYLHDEEEIKAYIDYVIRRSSHYRLNLYLLFFAIQYELFIRKERDFLCYFFSKNEGHTKAIEIREKVIQLLTTKLNIEDYKDAIPYDICKYLKNISYRYEELNILSLDFSINYLDLLDIKNSNEYALSDFFDMFKRLPHIDNVPSYKEKVTTVKKLIDIIISENPQYCKSVVKVVVKAKEEIKREAEGKVGGEAEGEAEIKREAEGKVGGEPEDIKVNIDNEVDEDDEVVTTKRSGEKKKKSIGKMKKSVEMFNREMKEYSNITEKIIIKVESTIRKIGNFLINRKRIIYESQLYDPIFEDVYNKIILNYKTKNILSKNRYLQQLNRSKSDFISGKHQSHPSKNDLLRFILLEDMCIKADILETFDEVETWHTNKINFLSDSMSKARDKMDFIVSLFGFIDDMKDIYIEYYEFVRSNDKEIYHTLFYMIEYNKTKDMMSKINLINSNIIIDVKRLTKLCSSFLFFRNKILDLIQYHHSY